MSSPPESNFGRHRLLRGGATVIAGTLSQQAINLVFVAILARKLSEGEFDEYAWALAFGVFFETFSDAGVDFVVTREVNQRDESEHGQLVGTAMAIKGALFAATFLLAVGASFAKPEFRGPALVVALGMFAGVPGTVGLALRARIRALGPEIVTTISALATGTVLIIAALNDASVLVLVTFAVAARLTTSAVAYPFLRRRLPYKFRFSRDTARYLLRAGLPVALSTFAVIIYTRSDQLVLGVVGERGQLGGYAAAVRMVSSVSFLAVAVGSIALPTFSHLEAYQRERLRRVAETAVRYLAVVLLPLAVGATIAGGPLLGVVFGRRFRSDGDVLAVLVWAHFFASSWVLARPILIARHKANYLSLLALVAAVVNVGLNIWLLPRYGGIGAAWSSLISYASPFAFALFLPDVRDAFTGPLRGCVRPAIAAAALLGLLSLLRIDVVPELLLLAVCTPIALLATRSITLKELRDMTGSLIHNR